MSKSPWDLNKKQVVDIVEQVITNFRVQKIEIYVALGLGSAGRNIKDEHTILIYTQSLF